MKLFKVLTFCFVFCVSFLSLDAQSINKEFADELKQKSQEINSIICLFSQNKSASFFSKNIVKTGKFYFKMPQDILLSYDDGDYIIMSGEWFKMNSSGKVNKTKISSNPMLKNLNMILSACISGNINKLTNEFDVSITSESKVWNVVMKPKDKRLAKRISSILLNFEKDNMSLSLMKMIEKSGDYTEYKFFDKKLNVAVDASIFNIAK